MMVLEGGGIGAGSVRDEVLLRVVTVRGRV